MKAIVYDRYGSSDVLRCEEVETPSIGDDEVLLKVRASSLNPYDWHFMRGLPYAVRLIAGIGKPKVRRLGHDVAGEIETIGRNVTRFKPGDAVYGSCAGALAGAFAEYARTSASALVLKPENLTFEQVAGVPIAGLTALQGLRDKGKIQAGQKVLVNGAAGGVGTFAVQIAKAFGADVTGVCSTRNLAMVRALGADTVIDYTREDFTKKAPRYDLILDTVGNHSLLGSMRVLNPNGIMVMAGGDSGKWKIGLTRGIRARLLSMFGSRQLLGILAKRRQEDLLVMNTLMDSGKVTPQIDRCYVLSEVPQAIRYLEEGHARGKIVIQMCTSLPMVR